MTLRYPLEIGNAASPDYIQFVPQQYRANDSRVGGAGPGQVGAQAVILYMPNSTPGIGNSNNWGAVNFEGPIGDLRKLFADGSVDFISRQKDLNIQRTIDDLKSAFTKFGESGKGLGGPALRQAGIQAVSQLVGGASGTQLLAMSQGKVFNPNVELLYTAPGMREFNFTFKFVPKSAQEASMINQIILNFKRWSAPRFIENGMMEVPHVWKVDYMTGGMENKNMNRFKKAACTSVTVQANPQTAMHVAFDDGMPVETVMALSFKEVDVITRQDHEEVQGQGF